MSQFQMPSFGDDNYGTLGQFGSKVMPSMDFLKSLQGPAQPANSLLTQPSYYNSPSIYAGGSGDLGAGVGDIGGGGSMWDSISKFLGGSKNLQTGEQTMGAGGAILGGVQALTSLWSGMKQYGLMKDQLSFAKDSFNKNYNAQMSATNTQLEDRQKARVASNSGAYMSVSDYMAKNGIKG